MLRRTMRNRMKTYEWNLYTDNFSRQLPNIDCHFRIGTLEKHVPCKCGHLVCLGKQCGPLRSFVCTVNVCGCVCVCICLCVCVCVRFTYVCVIAEMEYWTKHWSVGLSCVFRIRFDYPCASYTGTLSVPIWMCTRACVSAAYKNDESKDNISMHLYTDTVCCGCASVCFIAAYAAFVRLV